MLRLYNNEWVVQEVLIVVQDFALYWNDKEVIYTRRRSLDHTAREV